MSAAALRPRLQFGEALWWFFANASGMAFYDADTMDLADRFRVSPRHVQQIRKNLAVEPKQSAVRRSQK